MKFSGHYATGKAVWYYDIALNGIAIIANEDGLTLSCSESVVDVFTKNTGYSNKASIDEKGRDIIVSIYRDGEWKVAATFTRSL